MQICQDRNDPVGSVIRVRYAGGISRRTIATATHCFAGREWQYALRIRYSTEASDSLSERNDHRVRRSRLAERNVRQQVTVINERVDINELIVGVDPFEDVH